MGSTLGFRRSLVSPVVARGKSGGGSHCHISAASSRGPASCVLMNSIFKVCLSADVHQWRGSHTCLIKLRGRWVTSEPRKPSNLPQPVSPVGYVCICRVSRWLTGAGPLILGDVWFHVSSSVKENTCVGVSSCIGGALRRVLVVQRQEQGQVWRQEGRDKVYPTGLHGNLQ